MPKHEWVCDKCGRSVMFRQPELPEDSYRSEMNQDKTCVCGEEMYFDEIVELDPNTIIISPEDVDYSEPTDL